MNRFTAALAMLFTTGLAGCGARPGRPLDIIVIPDVSYSIVDMAKLFAPINAVTRNLHRGDRMTVVPITGDAEIESQDRIVTFDAPLHREAFDQDLERFKDAALKSLQALERASLDKPGGRTDVLGTFEIAEQKIADNHADGNQRRPVLICLSDYIQDDAQENFKTSAAVATPSRAIALARQLAGPRMDGPSVPAYLGLLSSRDLRQLDNNRRAGVRAFWMSYLTARGFRPTFAVDGPGGALDFVERARLAN